MTLAFASGESFSDLGPSSFDLSIPESIKRGAAKARILPKDLTQKMLRGALSYDAKTGFFIWKISPVGSVAVGSAAGSINGRGYIQIRLFGSRYTAHRLAWLYERGYLPDQHLDHIDGVRSNNALVNLREATLSQNQHNSPARGYSWDKNEEKYRSSITINGKRTFLGYFDSADDARAAFLSAHARLAGEFSFTRRPTANIAPFARGA